MNLVKNFRKLKLLLYIIVIDSEKKYFFEKV